MSSVPTFDRPAAATPDGRRLFEDLILAGAFLLVSHDARFLGAIGIQRTGRVAGIDDAAMPRRLARTGEMRHPMCWRRAAGGGSPLNAVILLPDLSPWRDCGAAERDKAADQRGGQPVPIDAQQIAARHGDHQHDRRGDGGR